MVEVQQGPFPITLTPCSSGRRKSIGNDSNSPEFEFWMVRNPSFPQPNLLSADELFSGGVILPLQNLHLANEDEPSHESHQPIIDPPPPPQKDQTENQNPPESSGSGHAQKPEPESAHILSGTGPALTLSKRFTDMFKKTETVDKGKNVKEKKREKKHGNSGGGVSAAELNINIWPFSRSRSAGNSVTRPRTTAAGRKVSSAPCSRSNSGGESKTRKWPSSPSRGGGVHLGRSSPVWQVRRVSSGVKNGEKSVKKIPAAAAAASRGGGGSTKGRGLSLNVPMCIGYRQQLSCRSDDNSAISIAAAAAVATGGVNGGGVAGEGVRGSNFFNIKGLFSKKVY